MLRSVCDLRAAVVLALSISVSLVNGQQAAIPLQGKSGLWTSIGSMTEARAGACAAQLQNSRVLIAGGQGSRGVLDSAELFDLQAGFSVAAAMSTPRATPTCVTLQDGRVLIAGGADAIGTAISGAEIYDPYTDRWSPVGDMAYSRSGHTAVRLSDGRVLIAGGEGQGAVRGSLEVFDPGSNAFSLLAGAVLAFPRKEHAAVALPDGRVLIAGGSDGSSALASTEIYDPATGTITLGPTLSSPRVGLSATVLMDGNVLIAGGSNGTRDLATAEIFDAASGTFVEAAQMTTPRHGQLAFLLPDNNQVLLIGGDQGNGSTELFTPWNNTFALTGSVQEAGKAATAAALGADGAVLVSGGASKSRVLDSSKLYGFATLKAVQEDHALTISGSGWQPGERVTLLIQQQSKTRADITTFAAADSTGNISKQQPMDQVQEKYTIVANGVISTASAGGGNTSANLDQCANGGVSNPQTNTGCAISTDWVNGNLGSSKAHYLEGDSLPYRLTMTNVSLASHTVTFEWDTTQGGKHALDYITTYNRTQAANPCAGVSGCTGAPGTFSTFAIPADPNLSNGFLGTQIPGVLTMFGGTITGVSAYALSGSYAGNSSTKITVTFTASVANPVLAWGGHIATRLDWGVANSAIAISGSPFHTRLLDLDGSGGNQDRALSSDAAIFPATITIIKSANVQSATKFDFTAGPSPLANFSLWDDGSVDVPDATPARKVFQLTTAANFTTYNVTESALTGWTGSAVCGVTSPNGGSSSVSGLTATLVVKEGETYTCTYTNTRNTHTVKLIKSLVPSTDSGLFDLTAAGTTATAQGNSGFAQNTNVFAGASNVTVSEIANAASGANLANYTSVLTCTGVSIPASTTSASFTMPDNDVTCTVTNTRKGHFVKLIKSLVPSGDSGRFDLTAAGTPATVQGNTGFALNNSVVGGTTNVSVSEIANAANGADLANYTSVLTCTGVSIPASTTSASFTMPDNDVTCTVTNTRKARKVTLTKTLVPSIDSGRFDLTAAGIAVQNLGDNGSAQNTNVVAGTTNVSVSEIANVANGASLTNYTSVLTCTGVSIPASTTSASFTMPDNDVTCTVTNTRKGHFVKLIKSLVPSTDSGRFDLTAAGTAATAQGNAGFALNSNVVGGTANVTVSEIANAVNGANLANYTSVLTCAGVSIPVSTTSASFTMPDNDVTCTVTNTRKAHFVKLIKSLVPTTDSGRFDLTAAGTTATAQGNTGFALNSNVVGGTANVTVSEIANAASGANLADYTSVLTCTGVSIGASTTSATFTMPDNDVTCTVTNTLKTGTLTLYKVCAPTTDTVTQFTVNVSGPQNTSQNLVCNGQSQTITLKAGSYTVGETAKAQWTLGGALTGGWSAPGSFAGDCPGGAVTVVMGQNKVCGILNVNAVCTPPFPPVLAAPASLLRK